MNPAIAPIIISHRLTRLIAWAGLWLVWAGAALSGMSCGFRKSRKLDRPRQQIMHMTRFVIATLRVRATHFVTRIKRSPRAYGPNARRRVSFRRADVGSVLRRKLRAPTLFGRIAKLGDALRNPETYAREIAKRIARNLTKIVRLYPPAFITTPLSAPFARGDARLDSS